MKRALVLASASVAIGLAAVTGSASAATNPSHNGLVRACNMLVPAAAFGMLDNAMSLDNPNGNAGMFNAVAVSGCS